MAELTSLTQIRLDAGSAAPLYKQLAEAISRLIVAGGISSGEKLPPTRELAGQLGLNRTTVSAAYTLLENSGLIEGQVGRGSFVAEREQPAAHWSELLPPLEVTVPAGVTAEISFASSRPSQDDFPLASFRRLAKEVIDSPQAADILQLGSPHGYPPLRRYLLEQAQASGIAKPEDDLIITNGCQQALDLVARLFAPAGSRVVVEDPGYHGMLQVFSRAGAELLPATVNGDGLEMEPLEEVLRRQPVRLLVVTPSFQNPTGATLTIEGRRRLLSLASRYGFLLVENDIYSELRYRGEPLPTLKALDESGRTILLRSYSKVSFPGLRVGWVIAPRAIVAHLAQAKQVSDLHSDQLAQAVLLRFAESGELACHVARARAEGGARLEAALAALRHHLPRGSSFTRPEGGMSLWVKLPAPVSAEALLSRVRPLGVDFLPGKYFSSRSIHERNLRISFGSLTTGQITSGLQILGEAAHELLAASQTAASFEPAPALV